MDKFEYCGDLLVGNNLRKFEGENDEGRIGSLFSRRVLRIVDHTR